ncbi:MAG: peptidoglycan-binding protein [Clostridium sp.]|nr:peptidoglycan-binding protein [Clostridium sp.]
MPITIVPYVPSTITVHMGAPDEWAENVTVSFPEYVKNVASSEIYPTWEPAAIRANILAIISFALNRVYTEFYPSRGYDFQITSTTAYDQKFIRNRNIFENVSQVVDEIFNDYLRRQGFVEPLSAKFCNGTTTTCDGLSQWGSQELARQGLDSMEILRRYYGDNIELVTDAPVQDVVQSYPGTPLRLGSVGEAVVVIQASLNRIGRNYPAIPKIATVSGIFDESTEEAVREFQRIFNLTPDGVVGKATWYRIVSIYVGVNRLAELVSMGQTFYAPRFEFPGTLREGDSGGSVRILQYMLALLAEFDNVLRPVSVDGTFGPGTAEAVRQYQSLSGLTVDGVVGEATWDSIYRRFGRLYHRLEGDAINFPRLMNGTVPTGGEASQPGGSGVRLGQHPGRDVGLGDADVRKETLV